MSISQYALSKELYTLFSGTQRDSNKKYDHSFSFLKELITPLDAHSMIQYFRLEDIVALEDKTTKQIQSLLSSKIP